MWQLMFDRENDRIQLGRGSLKVCSRPRGGDWLVQELERFRASGVTDLVSLLTAGENRELGLTHEAELSLEMGFRFTSFPIVDRSVPEDRKSFLALAQTLADRIEEGGHALLHCRAGLGRAPLLAVAILTRSGNAVEDAWSMLEQHRGRGVPDTAEQKGWLGTCDSLEEALRRANDPIF